MDAAAQLEATVELFERVEIEVRKELLGGSGGGLCRLRDRRILFIDLDADLATQLDRCLAALAVVPEIDTLYVSPELREKIDFFRENQIP